MYNCVACQACYNCKTEVVQLQDKGQSVSYLNIMYVSTCTEYLKVDSSKCVDNVQLQDRGCATIYAQSGKV